MKPIDNTEDFVRRGKAKVTTDPQMDKHVLDDSFAAMDQNIGGGTATTSRTIFISSTKRLFAAVLIAGIAFLGGRLSVPRELPGNVETAPRAAADSDGITVTSDLVAWLDAACLFRQLGMEDRMADAVESAGRLLPPDSVAASSAMDQSFARTGDGVFESQNKYPILAEILRPDESVERVGGIMAQSLGGYYHESKMD